MDNTNSLIALGHEAELFNSSDLGIYVNDRALLEIEQAQDKLSVVDPEDLKQIRYLQNIIMVHKNFKQWLDDAAMAGELAYSEYLEAEE